MKPTDIKDLIDLGAPTLSPDGSTAVVAVSRPDLDEDEYPSQLWTIATDAETPPRRLTHGKDDSAPRFSPDGRWIAFLRALPEGKPQLHVLPADGGDARCLTDLPLGAGAPSWSPDSTRIAFSARVPEKGRYGTDEKITAEKEAPRRVTGLQYRLDNVGFTTDRRKHLYVVDVAESDAKPEPRQLTDGDWDDTDPTWTPDGAAIAFLSRRHERREHDYAVDVFTVLAGGGDATALTDSSLSLMGLEYSADGGTLFLVGEDISGDLLVARNVGVFALDVASAPAAPRRLTDVETVNVGGDTLVVRESDLLLQIETRGTVELAALPFDGGAPTTVLGGPRVVIGFDAAGDTLALSYGDAERFGELGVARGASLVRLTDFAQLAVRPVTDFEATAADGQTLHGFVVEPEGDGPHPVLLMIHGGPFASYTWRVFDEAQVYAGAGYAVVYTNPRGSSGYGETYGSYIRGDVGERSGADLLALLDKALERPSLDGDRVGVLGGSHGGFMTSWLVGHTDRFKAAVSERAVNAIDSFTGASDIGWSFADDLYTPDLEAQRRQSPLTYADDITTPLLIVHSEHDWRCPIEQAQRLYVALRRRDHDVEMLIFPNEGHELSRSGLPSHRVARFDAIVEWFDRKIG